MFKIPSTVERAGRELANLDGLITARSWQRAAIVYAFTEPGQQGRGETSSSGRLSFYAFAELGIQGLRSRETVRDYYGHWQYAIDQGKAQPVGPGDRVDEPDLDFPPNPRSEGGTVRSAKSLPVEQRRQLAEEILRDPEVQVAPSVIARQASRPDVARAIVRNDAAREAVEDEAIEHRAEQYGPPPIVDPQRSGRTVERRIAERLGQDPVVERLRDANESAAEALAHYNDAGTTDEAGMNRELDQLQRVVHALRGETDVLTPDDITFLNEIGAR
jgi:hypothetical protein